jgi:IS30 family transposase
VIERLADLPVYTLTTDNGSENQRWEEIEEALNIDCFFAHPYRSCERGANENVNGLLRDYYPKKTDFRTIPDEEIARVEYALNSRPRKRLGFMTPLEVWGGAIEG